jgi:hypothetical protein
MKLVIRNGPNFKETDLHKKNEDDAYYNVKLEETTDKEE